MEAADDAEVEPQAEAVGERGGGTASSELAAEAMAAPDPMALPPRPEEKVGPQVQAKLRSLIGFIAGDPDATWGKLLCDTPKVRLPAARRARPWGKQTFSAGRTAHTAERGHG